MQHTHHPHADEYRPRQDLVRQTIARHQHCRAPGCTRPAAQCQLDHVEEWPTGITCSCNIAPLCTGHHQLKTLKFTDYELHPDASVTWTTYLGRRYEEPPPDDLRGN